MTPTLTRALAVLIALAAVVIWIATASTVRGGQGFSPPITLGPLPSLGAPAAG